MPHTRKKTKQSSFPKLGDDSIQRVTVVKPKHYKKTNAKTNNPDTMLKVDPKEALYSCLTASLSCMYCVDQLLVLLDYAEEHVRNGTKMSHLILFPGFPPGIGDACDLLGLPSNARYNTNNHRLAVSLSKTGTQTLYVPSTVSAIATLTASGIATSTASNIAIPTVSVETAAIHPKPYCTDHKRIVGMMDQKTISILKQTPTYHATQRGKHPIACQLRHRKTNATGFAVVCMGNSFDHQPSNFLCVPTSNRVPLEIHEDGTFQSHRERYFNKYPESTKDSKTETNKMQKASEARVQFSKLFPGSKDRFQNTSVFQYNLGPGDSTYAVGPLFNQLMSGVSNDSSKGCYVTQYDVPVILQLLYPLLVIMTGSWTNNIDFNDWEFSFRFTPNLEEFFTHT